MEPLLSIWRAEWRLIPISSREKRSLLRFARLLAKLILNFTKNSQTCGDDARAPLMTIRFQADAELNRLIVLAVIRREPNLDFRTAEVAGLTGLKDHEVLAVAAGEGRVLVSHDQKTMPRHFAEFIVHTPS